MNNLQQAVIEAMREGRDMALDGAIELCEDAARDGHNASYCVAVLHDLKKLLATEAAFLSHSGSTQRPGSTQRHEQSQTQCVE